MWPFTGKGSGDRRARDIAALEDRITHLEARFGDFVKRYSLRVARSTKDAGLMEELLRTAAPANKETDADLLARVFKDGR